MTVSEPLFEIVRRAWQETLPRTPFDPEMTWEDAGADSLKSLEFLMRLETALDRKLAFDQFSLDMTARGLAEALANQNASPAPAASTLPRVLLIPGVYGDAPALARFRAAAADRIAFELVPLPGIDVSTRVHRDLAATAQVVARTICAAQSNGPLIIAGFSFGGLVAHEVVRQLEAEGMAVSGLILIDPHLASASNPAHSRALEAEAHPARSLQGARPDHATMRQRKRHPLRWTGMAPAKGERWSSWRDRALFSLMVRLRLIECARRYIHDKPATVTQAIWRRKVILGLSRMNAVARWKPAIIASPALLILSQEGTARGMAGQWQDHCRQLSLAQLPFTHIELLTPEPIGQIIDAISDFCGSR